MKKHNFCSTVILYSYTLVLSSSRYLRWAEGFFLDILTGIGFVFCNR